MKKSFVKFINNEAGFTLIELLIVLAIIGILSSFLLANLIGAKAHARDAQRKSDIRQMQAAFELYRSDQGAYPASPLPACGSQLQAPSGGSVYMQKIPCDPLTNASYSYTVNGAGYTLVACLENTNDTSGVSLGSCSTGWGYQVTNP